MLDVRKEQGARSSKEIWRSLETGDLRTAKVRLAQAKARILEGFEQELLTHAGRPRIKLDQIKAAVTLFASTVEASLLNERLLTLPSGPQVGQARTELDGINRAILDARSMGGYEEVHPSRRPRVGSHRC